MIDMPYFMENENWYYYDYEKMKYRLTKDAPEKAVKSYEEYYLILKRD